MAWNFEFPYTDSKRYNDDWLLRTIKELVKEIENFVNLNTIKYADPIEWDITRQYEANTVVVDARTGNAYISTHAVPAGVQINNAEYWTQIYNYADIVDTVRAQIATNEGDTTTASQRFEVGDWVFVSGLLYEVIAPMIAGDSFVVDSNVKKVTVEELVKVIKTALDNAFQGIINETQARTDADTAINGRIDNEVQARADADTAINGRIDSLALGVTTLNENQQRLLNRKFVLIADSYGLNPSADTSWVAKLIDNLDLTVGVNAFYYSEGGASFGGNDGLPLFQNMVNNISVVGADLDDITDVVICGGYNDIDGVHGATVASILAGIAQTKANVSTRFPNARLHIGFVGATTNASLLVPLVIALNAYIKACATNSIHYLNNVEFCLHHDVLIQNDGIHPTADGSIGIADAVSQALLTGSADVVKVYKNSTFTAATGVTMATFNWVLGQQLTNNNLLVNMFYSADTTQFSFDPAIDISDEIELGTITDTYLIGSAFDTFSATCLCDVGGNTGTYLSNVPVRISVRNRTVYAKIFGTLASGEAMNGLIIKGRYTVNTSPLVN